MKRAYIVLAAICAVFLASCATAPDLRVSGVVRDAASREPLAGARIHEGRYATDLAAEATSDIAGAFAYYTYPEEHSIYVEKDGYLTVKALVGLDPASREDELSIEMRKDVSVK